MDIDAFDVGYDAGFKAGIKGDFVIPSANTIAVKAGPVFHLNFITGAALGLERGRERKEDLERRASAQIEERGLEWVDLIFCLNTKFLVY